MRLLDKRQNIIVDVEDSLVNEALKSGNYEIRPGVPVPVVYSDGSEGTVLSEDMPLAVQDGVKYRTAQEDRAKAQDTIETIKRETYDKPATAFTLGALRGATLGLSDVAARGIAEATGQEGAIEAMREVAERSPTASLAGEISGGIASFVTPTGAAGALTRVAGAPIRGATKLGEAAAKGIGDATALARMGKAATAGAVEGAAIGAGQTVSELALADPELTAQKAVANIALGSVFGGALSGAARGTWDAGTAAATKALTKVGEIEFIPKTAKELTGWLTEKYGKASAIARGDFEASLDGLKIDEEYSKLFARGSQEERKQLVHYLQNPDKLRQEFAESITAGTQIADDLEKIASQTAKVQKGVLNADIGKVDKRVLKKFDDVWSDEAELADELGIEGLLYRKELKGSSLEKAEKSARATRFDKVDAEGRKLIKQLDDVAADMRKQNSSYGGDIFEPGAIKAIDDTRAELSKRFFNETRTLTDINDAIVSAKNQIAKQGRIFDRNPQFMSNQEMRSSDKLRDVWKSLKEASVNEELFGEFGAAVAKRADVLSTIKSSVDDFNNLFYIQRKNRAGQWERIPNERAQELFIRSAGNTANFKKQIALDDFKAGIKEAAEQLEPLDIRKLDDEILRLRKLAQQNSKRMVNKAQQESKERAAKYLDEQIKKMEAERENVTLFNKSVQETKELALKNMEQIEKQIEGTMAMKVAAKLIDRMESKTGRSLGGMLSGGLAGSLIPGGPIFEIAGAVIGGALQNPKSALKFASAIETAADGFDRMAGAASIKFKNFERRVQLKKGLTGKAIPATRQTLIRDKLRIEPGERNENNEKAFRKHRDTLNRMAQSSEDMSESILAALGDGALENPRLSLEVVATAERAVSFLQSKIPRDPYAPGLYPDDFVPSPVEMSQYADYAQAVMRPKTLIKQIEAANINPRTVEAVKAVYPRLYEDLKLQISAKLMESKKVPYDQRVQLGVLFEVPSVKALQPDYMRRLMGLTSGSSGGEEQNQGSQRVGQGATMNRTQMVGFREMEISERQQRV